MYVRELDIAVRAVLERLINKGKFQSTAFLD